MLTFPPTLALPTQGLEYFLYTDAMESQLSACFQQRDEHGVLHPIGYLSRQLSPTERHYHITEKEAYAVYWAVKLLRPYLEGNRFTVRTNHSALTWLFIADGNSTPRLTRWRLGLAQFDFIAKYRPGVQHQPADGVSRLVTLSHDSSAVEDNIPYCVVADDAIKESVHTPGPALEDAVLELITLHELIDAQSQDPFCLSKLSELDGATMKRLFAVNDKGLLVKLSPLDKAEQVLVPRSLANRVMCLAHLPRLAAHPGCTHMYATLSKLFYWLSMAKDTYQFVANVRRAPRVV
jgi:RNase H-like domain found in reverse transcriptase/Integrase zinc binding domain